MEKCRLELVGITYNQIDTDVYAMILQQAGGTRRIPIIIGFAEAQSMECKLQNVVTPRPLTHDLMISVMSTFGISLKEVNISKIPMGVFAAELVLVGDFGERRVDSRSSDAVALAIRVGAPIYISRELLEEAGFEPGEPAPKGAGRSSARFTQGPKPPTASFTSDMNLKSIQQLNDEMQKAVEAENYEEALRLKREIERRKRR